MKVLVIPEDFRKDQFILSPLIAVMLKKLGKPNCKIIVCRDPLLGGIDRALKWDLIEAIIERYRGMIDLFLLCVDRDGNANRRQALDMLEQKATVVLPVSKKFLAENAWQEVEVWLLAGHSLPKEWSWQAIRNHNNPKEAYFLPFATQKKLQSAPAQGRKILAEEAVRSYDRIRRLCPEDVANLENRIGAWLNVQSQKGLVL